jgi:hypothetical protein
MLRLLCSFIPRWFVSLLFSSLLFSSLLLSSLLFTSLHFSSLLFTSLHFSSLLFSCPSLALLLPFSYLSLTLPFPFSCSYSDSRSLLFPLKSTGVKYKGAIDCGVKTVQETGFFSLYRGLSPVLIASFPKAGVRFASFEQFKVCFIFIPFLSSSLHYLLFAIGKKKKKKGSPPR